MSTATVLAPATIGNVGPGFDVLGLAVDGLYDQVNVRLTDGPPPPVIVGGIGAGTIPTDPQVNGAAVAAREMLKLLGDRRSPAVTLDRALPLSGGLGGSAADCAGGALAAAMATGKSVSMDLIMTAALAGEERVSGRHLDNIAPCLLGGLCLVRGTDPPDVVRITVAADWQIVVVTPDMALETKTARGVLPQSVPRATFVRQMANTGALIAAFFNGDAALASRALDDAFAEPARAPLIPGFAAVKAAALAAGALGCSISGAGPTVFALCRDVPSAAAAGVAMRQAFAPLAAKVHFGPINRRGAVVVEPEKETV